MNRIARISVLAGLLLSVLPVLAGPLDAQSSPEAQGCRTTNVLLLIDQSQSLQDTDPSNLRVTGAEELIRSLANSAEASGEIVNLAIAGFGEGAAVETQVTLPEQRDLAKASVDQFAARNTDQNTDYVLALRLALDHFSTMPGVLPACSKVVWFTDGAYSIDQLDAPDLAKYTSSRNKGTIQSQLGDQICGPLPDGSTQDRSVSEAIHLAGFSVQMIDLRVEGAEKPQDRNERAQTRPVIDRLLDGDPADPCRIAGGRVEATAASDLATKFFAQGQLALGHFELDCNLLASGYPATMVTALAVQNSNVDGRTELLIDGESKAGGQGFANYSPASGPASSGVITARAASGTLKSCFADLRATVASQGDAAVFAKAGRSYLYFKVNGTGAIADGAGVTPSYAALTATVNGSASAVEWDEPSRSWRLTINGPLTVAPVVVATARAVGWQGPEFAPFSPLVDLRNEPPAPQVAWKGPTTVEGKTTVDGELVITPAALKTGGELCVTFQEPKSVPDTLSVSLAEPRLICHSDEAPFSLPASLTTSSSSNGTGQVTLPYTTEYRPQGSTSEIDIGGVQEVVFPPVVLVKPADATRVALISGALLILSIVFSLGILVALTNRALRLPDPTKFRSVSVPLEVADGVIRRAADSGVRPEDFTLIAGDRGKYVLPDGVELRSRKTVNPFTDLSAKAVASSGVIGVVPALSREVAPRVTIPSSFDQLTVVALETTGLTGTATVVAKKGASLPMVEGSIDDAIERVNTERASASNAARRLMSSVEEEGESVSSSPPAPSVPITPTQTPQSAPTHGSNPKMPPPPPPAPTRRR